MNGTSTGAELITAERQRQIGQEGYTPEHDEMHTVYEFVMAAGAYLGLCAWPWSRDSFKPSTDAHYAERDLVRAGALIAAAVDRLGRVSS